jgi:DNA-binding MarR family transcriptional regulator
MQRLSEATKRSSAQRCAADVLETAPLVHWFIRTQMRVYRRGLSLPQFRCLMKIGRQPSASLSVVAEHLGASLPTASRIVAGLVDKRLLARQNAVRDRRQVSLVLTPRGQAMLSAARAATQRKMQKELNVLNAKQSAAVVDAMEILKRVFAPLRQQACESGKC